MVSVSFVQRLCILIGVLQRNLERLFAILVSLLNVKEFVQTIKEKEISAIESCFNTAKGQNDPNFESYKQTLTHGIGEKIFFITGSIFDNFVND